MDKLGSLLESGKQILQGFMMLVALLLTIAGLGGFLLLIAAALTS